MTQRMTSAMRWRSPATKARVENMSQKLLTSAVFAGVAAGLIAALLQFWLVIPSLLEAELYETGERLHFSAVGSPQSPRGAPPLGDDWQRHFMSIGFNLVTYVGFAFLLLAAMVYAEWKGLSQISARTGLIWGIAGFFIVQMAPAVGLPPGLPGTIGPDVGARQAWWLGTIASTGIGLWLIAFMPGVSALVGLVFVAVPHLIGAPQLDTYWGVAPPELAAQFAARSLGVAAAGWAALGGFAGWLWSRSEG